MNRPTQGHLRAIAVERNRLLRLTMLAGFAAGLLFTVATFAARSDAAVVGSRAGEPTIVLVHGAWANSSSWDGVTTRLQSAGYMVDVEANPLRGLLSDADYLDDYLSTIDGPVVLVGHSYGGAVITNAATTAANVKALVYIDAFAPDQGETVVGLATAMPGSAIGGDPTSVFDAAPYPTAPPGDVDLYVKQKLFTTAFANDLPIRQARVLAAAQRPVAFSALATPSGTPAWKTIPSWYFVGTRDHVLPPAEQLFMARRANATTVEVPASHLAMVSHPAAVARLILAAAQHVH